MQAKTANFYLDKGSEWRYELQILGVDNIPIEMHDMRVAAEMCYIMRDNIKTKIDCTIIDPHIGLVLLSIPSRRSERLPEGDYIYNIELLDGMGIKHRILQGKISFEEETTIIY